MWEKGVSEFTGLCKATLLESGRMDALVQGCLAPELLFLTIYTYEGARTFPGSACASFWLLPIPPFVSDFVWKPILTLVLGIPVAGPAVPRSSHSAFILVRGTQR